MYIAWLGQCQAGFLPPKLWADPESFSGMQRSSQVGGICGGKYQCFRFDEGKERVKPVSPG
jgi:hypothetical protein